MSAVTQHITALIVTPTGLKPVTYRTGICCSIQLNYGAFRGTKINQNQQKSKYYHLEKQYIYILPI